MRHQSFPVILFGLMFLPQLTFGAVRVSEISWMGNTDSSTNEWIELANDGGESISLAGWVLEATDGSPSISLSGSISAEEYFLIERTDDDSVPDITADLIAPFGNGLSNSGETLRLKDGGGNIVDEVVGTDAWANIGGDNETKATAQRTSLGWITATPTPRSANASAGEQPSQTQETGVTTATTSSGTAQSGSVTSAASTSPYPRANITALAPEDLRVYVGAPVLFSGNSKGLFDEELPYATYHWNFGDGSVSTGRTAEHIYQNVGNYLVVLDVSWGGNHATDRLKVSVTRADAVITAVSTSSDGVVLIKNTSSRELDLSGWTLGVSSTTYFVFPANSVVLPSESLPLALRVTSVPTNSLALDLRYENGNIASSYVRAIPIGEQSSRTRAVTVATANSVSGRVLGVLTQEGEKDSRMVEEIEKNRPVPIFSTEEKTTSDVKGPRVWGGALFVALMLFGVAGTLYLRRHTKTEAEKYEIIEDESENPE